MDGISTTPESPGASTETVASPAPAPSASAEALQGGTPTQTVSPAPVGESQPPVQEIEFPDDNVFQALPPEQRRSNWQQLREQYAETKRKLGELSGLESAQPIIQQLDERGGYERLASQAEWADGLFAPVLDPDTNEPVFDANGMPQYTAEPFIERLSSESPSTFGEVMWRGFDMPSPYNESETIGHLFLRERLGLDPNLIDTYRQIQSPQDAARFMSPGHISPEELASVPERFHEVIRTLTPELRDEVGLMGQSAKEQFLANQQELYENRKFREEQKAFQAEQREREQQAFEQRVQQDSERLITSVRDASINAQRERLGKEAVFSTEADVNSAVWDEILSYAQSEVMKDPLLAKDSATCERLYRLSALYAAQGDNFKSHEARVQADRLATKLTGRFTNSVTSRTAFWSKVLGASRAATQQQIQNAQPRVEIGSNSSQSRPPNKQVLTAPNGEGFGFSPERLAQFKAQLDQARMGQ